MRIRLPLLSVVLAFGLLGCGKDPAASATNDPADGASAKVFKWKMVTAYPKNFPGLGLGPENLAKLVARMSNGRLQIKVYGANELVPPFEVFDTVSAGTAEMGHSAAYYWTGKSPAAAFFTAVPFGMTAQERNGWLHYGGGMALWRELYANFNLVPFAGGNTGVQMGGWFNKEINSVEDLKGLKMRIPGLGGDVLNRLGGTSVTLPGSELYTSMQTGVIDAVEWVSPYNDIALGLHQVADYYYYPGWQEAGPNLEFTVNKQAWDSLPDDLQAIVEAATRAINQDMLDEYTARNADALTELVEQHGVQLRAFPDDVMAAIARESAAVKEDLASSDPFARRVYDSMSAFQTKAGAYGRISEQSYMNARDSVAD